MAKYVCMMAATSALHVSVTWVQLLFEGGSYSREATISLHEHKPYVAKKGNFFRLGRVASGDLLAISHTQTTVRLV